MENKKEAKELDLEQLEKVNGGNTPGGLPDPIFICNHCGVDFGSSILLKQHLEKIYGNVPPAEIKDPTVVTQP